MSTVTEVMRTAPSPGVAPNSSGNFYLPSVGSQPACRSGTILRPLREANPRKKDPGRQEAKGGRREAKEPHISRHVKEEAMSSAKHKLLFEATKLLRGWILSADNKDRYPVSFNTKYQ